MSQNYDVANAHNRMGNLVDDIFDSVPNVTILVTTLPPNTNAATNANINIFNGNLPKMVAARPTAKLMIADVNSALNAATDLISDGEHPNDAGFAKIATVWENAIAWAYLMVSCPRAYRTKFGPPTLDKMS